MGVGIYISCAEGKSGVEEAKGNGVCGLSGIGEGVCVVDSKAPGHDGADMVAGVVSGGTLTSCTFV